ncbi:MAG: hypothetical protein ACI9AP_000882, partial [Flavobacteriales bacterium]
NLTTVRLFTVCKVRLKTYARRLAYKSKGTL